MEFFYFSKPLDFITGGLHSFGKIILSCLYLILFSYSFYCHRYRSMKPSSASNGYLVFLLNVMQNDQIKSDQKDAYLFYVICAKENTFAPLMLSSREQNLSEFNANCTTTVQKSPCLNQWHVWHCTENDDTLKTYGLICQSYKSHRFVYATRLCHCRQLFCYLPPKYINYIHWWN